MADEERTTLSDDEIVTERAGAADTRWAAADADQDDADVDTDDADADADADDAS